MRILVCGGRAFADCEFVCRELSRLHGLHRFTTAITGGAVGVDTFAHDWAAGMGLSTEVYRADWERFGRAAGPIRNKRMLDEGRPDLVVAFPGGRGTRNMVSQARFAGVEVMVIGAEEAIDAHD
jgi:hypothetical protein